MNEDLKTLNEYRNESRRLREILNAIAQAERGKGAVIELYVDRDPVDDRHSIGVVICRADMDEEQFMLSVREGLERLAEAATGLRAGYEAGRKTGVESER